MYFRGEFGGGGSREVWRCGDAGMRRLAGRGGSWVGIMLMPTDCLLGEGPTCGSPGKEEEEEGRDVVP